MMTSNWGAFSTLMLCLLLLLEIWTFPFYYLLFENSILWFWSSCSNLLFFMQVFFSLNLPPHFLFLKYKLFILEVLIYRVTVKIVQRAPVLYWSTLYLFSSTVNFIICVVHLLQLNSKYWYIIALNWCP